MKLALFACLVAFALALPLAADSVITTDGRELKGEVIEDGDTVIVKMKIGTIKLKRSEVKEIKRDGGAAPAASGGPSGETYKSYLLGYVLHVPSTKYVLQRVPPEPLTDVLLFDSQNECEIGLGVCAFEDMPKSLSGDAARDIGKGVQGGLALYYSKIDVISAEARTLGPFDTAHVVLEGKRRDTKRMQHLVYIAFWLRDTPMVLRGEALMGKHRALDADADRIVETLEGFEPKEMDGDTYVEMKGCYSIVKPPAWTVGKHDSKDDGGEWNVACDKPKLDVSVQWKMDRTKSAIVDLGKEKEVAMKKSGAQVASSKVANLKGRVCWQIEAGSKGGPQQRAWLFRTVDRVYTIETSWAEADAAQATEATKAVFESFQFYPDLLSKGSLENGRKAGHYHRQGDEKLFGGDPGAAIGFYDEAIDLYPPFSNAYNNRGLAYGKQEQFDEEYKDLQKASELSPHDFLVSRNMAVCRLEKAYGSLDDGRISSALQEADRMRSRAKDDEELSEVLGMFYFKVGQHYIEQEKLGAAKAFFKKGMDFYHDKKAVKKYLSQIATAEGVDAANKGNWNSAKQFFEEALKYDPGNGQAKQFLEKVKQELSK